MGIDAFSRKGIGWELDDRLEPRLAIAAPKSLIHPSDRGAQYARPDCAARLEARKIAIGMSRPANPCDDARNRIGEFLDTMLDAKRPRSAPGYKPPDAF